MSEVGFTPQVLSRRSSSALKLTSPALVQATRSVSPLRFFAEGLNHCLTSYAHFYGPTLRFIAFLLRPSSQVHVSPLTFMVSFLGLSSQVHVSPLRFIVSLHHLTSQV